MQCQTATLNSFRSILMGAQSQGLSLHPLDQQSWLGNMAICNFISMLLSLHPNISLSPSKLSSAYPLFIYIPPFLSFSHCLSVSLCLRLPFSRSLHLFLLVRYACFFFTPSPLFDFFMQDVSLNNFKSQSLAFSSSAPICLFAPLFPASVGFFFFFSFFVSPSPAASMCSRSAETERSPRTESVGVCEQE